MYLYLILSLLYLQSETPVLQYDNQGHVVITDVVKTTIEESLLIKNTRQYFNEEEGEVHGINQEFQKTFKIKFYKTRLIKSPHGLLKYVLKVDVKNDRYRYVFTDFIFYPYTRDRYARHKLDKRKSKRLATCLEEDENIWATHKIKLLDEIGSQIQHLKKEMIANKSETLSKDTVKITGDW